MSFMWKWREGLTAGHVQERKHSAALMSSLMQVVRDLLKRSVSMFALAFE